MGGLKKASAARYQSAYQAQLQVRVFSLLVRRRLPSLLLTLLLHEPVQHSTPSLRQGSFNARHVVGELPGASEGTLLGLDDGFNDGASVVGELLGTLVGELLGLDDGDRDGTSLGLPLGKKDGTSEGT
mmetsp:Transcript_8603/g.24116  ORF Transcript_8603/g.24116 Transcript_8603/m.24116 type:complete len:128 (-) Transcript_8603:520-903(-)